MQCNDCFTLNIIFWIIIFKGGRNIMNIGNQILNIRKENQLTQEEFGRLFHVTRQTVSNWENGKSYPDLQILVSMSNQFDISLDTLLKKNSKMVQSMDKERAMGIKNQRVTKKVFQYIEQLKNIDTN